MLLDYLKEKSRIVSKLAEDGPITLEDILMPYCETTERFEHVVGLLERLPQLETDRLKLSNCFLDGNLPYDSLVGLETSDLETLLEFIDYLDIAQKKRAFTIANVTEKVNLYESISEKLELAIKNGTDCSEEYSVLGKYPHEGGRIHHMPELGWYNVKRIGWDNLLCDYLALVGDLRGLKHYHEEKKYFWNEWTCEHAAQMGHLDCLEYAHTHGCPWDVKTTIAVTKYGRLECLKYALEHGCRVDRWVCDYAIINGHFDCFYYAFEKGCPRGDELSRYAAQYGTLELLKFVIQHCGMHEYISLDASKNKNVECFEYVHNLGCRKLDACRSAAYVGNLDGLKFAHKNGYPWDANVCSGTVAYDHVDCLKYAVENGCPWNKEECLKRAKKDSACAAYILGLPT